ncbi:MAG TPA: RsmE family RNA methyltransferase [Candidatus Dormibacteraeota bacterium]|nr:RsmE family RNA methyltransferase [Candidatus Dormibacteraeota bacterium]
MPAFFARREGDRAFVEGADAHHLARSLRARPGQEIEVVDPAGFMLTVRLDVVTPESVVGTVTAERPHHPEPNVKVTIAIANLPAPALDLVLSRCTEAGAHAFTIFQAERSVGRGFKRERANAICRESAMLAGRLHVPSVVHAATPATAYAGAEHAVWLVREAPTRLSEIPPRDMTLFVGPEGGWSERELQFGGAKATLGPRNMRAETAAIVALAVVLANA